MKKLFLFLLLIPAGVSAEEVRINDLSGGMFSYYSDNKIPDNTAHSIKNMYTDQEAMAVQRNGYVAFKNGVTGFNIPGMWRFTDTTQTEWLIWFSSKSVFGYSGQISTSTVFQFASTNIPDCTTNLGRFWCTNGSDDLAWWDGVSSGTVPSAPHGSLIASWRNRIVLANIPSSISTMRFSADGDGTLWTLGINPTDPFSRQIGGANDGYAINCLRGSYYDNLIVGRKYDLWYGSGFDASDLGFRNISQEVGCLQSPKMQEFDGSLMFLSWRGIEQMTGTQIQLVSEPIRDLVDPIVKNVSNGRSLSINTATGWNAGTFTGNTVYVDTETKNGSLQTTFPDQFDAYRNGIGTKNVWTDYLTTNGSRAVNSSELTLAVSTAGSTLDWGCIRTTLPLNSLVAGTSFQIKIDSLTTTNDPTFNNNSIFSFLLSTTAITGTNTFANQGFVSGMSNNATWEFIWISTAVGKATLHTVANLRDTTASLTVSTTVTVPFIFNVWISTSNFSYGVNGTQIKSASYAGPGNESFPNYAYLIYQVDPFGLGGQAQVDYFSVAPETYTFTSAAQTISSAISSWDSFSTAKVDTSGSTLFGVRSNSVSSYTAVTSGQTPAISTSTYWQVISTVSYTVVGSTLTPVSISNITQNWIEGSAPPLASMVYDRRYWLSYAENLNVTPAVNDNTLVFQRNHTWTKFTFGAASYALWKNNLYFGDSTTGSNVFLFDSGTADNGAAINAEIIFKSLDMGLPSHEKSFRNLWMSYLGSSSFSGTITVSANADRGSYASLGTAALNESSGQALAKFPFTLTNGIPERGREIQIKVSKNVSGDKLKLYDLVLELYPKEAR